MTQREVAQALKLDTNQLARWERGDQEPNVGHLKMLADYYQRPVDHFFAVKLPWT